MKLAVIFLPSNLPAARELLGTPIAANASAHIKAVPAVEILTFLFIPYSPLILFNGAFGISQLANSRFDIFPLKNRVMAKTNSATCSFWTDICVFIGYTGLKLKKSYLPTLLIPYFPSYF
jgi:hypothetical protein